MVNWNCCSALCNNNHRTRLQNGEKIKYYKLPRKPDIQKKYSIILKTTGINFKKGYICCEHWSKGYRSSSSDLPDVPVPSSQVERLQNEKKSTKSKRKSRLLKKKLSTVKQLSDSTKFAKKRKPPKDRFSLITEKPTLKKRKITNEMNNMEHSIPSLELEQAEESPDQRVKELEKQIAQIESNTRMKIKSLENRVKELEEELSNTSKVIACKDTELSKKSFSYIELKVKPNTFKYMCGLSVEQFELLWKCIKPYSHLIRYSNQAETCRRKGRLLDQETELLSVLTCCRHGLDLGIIAYMAGISETTMQRIFTSWLPFLTSLFQCIDLKPMPGFIKKMMPKIFMDTGHNLTDQIGDCTEFKLQNSSNFELNSLTFSDYKNTTTAKAYVGIAPHGGGLIFSDLYPGSISDSEITSSCNALDLVEGGHELMTDKGFAVQELCSERGILHNRPAMKSNDQFNEVEVADNLRIHVERFIGRVRDWSILNKVWPVQRMDLLDCTWKVICNIVNLCCEPIGPKQHHSSKQ